jgi:hypothetical protein
MPSPPRWQVTTAACWTTWTSLRRHPRWHTIEAKGQEIFDTILRAACGEKIKSELSDAEAGRDDA